MESKYKVGAAAVVAVIALCAVTQAQSQAPANPPAPAGQAAQEPAPPPPTPRASAPIDLTGTWVAVITEDWRWRMVTPAKGDYASIPMNFDAKKVADAWDPAADEAAGEQCKAYGAPGLMRLPTRLRISWQDENTLQVETDAGRQTRVLHFGDWKPASVEPSPQGNTTAVWETPSAGRGGAAQRPAAFGNLKTVTTALQPGYLRKNGVPYSDRTTLTEYWDLLRQRNGDQWLVVTTVVEDPTYLRIPWITTLNFKKEADGSKWDPSPCLVR